MTDDHALSAISAYNGYLAEAAPTSNIDRIANEGVLFNKFYCTNSISGPSRASILTGKYSHINGFYKNEEGGDFDGSQQIYQRILKENGYETAVIGKWHLGSSPTGFDYYKVLFNKEGQGSYYNPVFESTGVSSRKKQENIPLMSSKMMQSTGSRIVSTRTNHSC